MNEDVNNIFGKYMLVLEQEQAQQAKSQGKPLGQLVGASGGGEGGNWGGSLPKLISILPFGVWKPSSLKRSRVSTRSGFTSDHHEGNQIAYAADFGLNSTFGSRKEDATKFAIAVARNAGKNISSWDPFVGNVLNHITPDGYRVQIIWLSNVGGNHYDHVHVGVKKTSGATTYTGQQQETEAQDSENDTTQNQTQQTQGKEESPYSALLSQITAPLRSGGFTKEAGMKALGQVLGTAKAGIEQMTGKN